MTVLSDDFNKVLRYEPDTGLFFWKATNKIAGSKKVDGRIHIVVGGEAYKAHRLAWLFVHGSFPRNQIDHINHICDDNRIVNLRDVTNQENQRNARRSKANVSGVTGVYWHKASQKWLAQIRIDMKDLHLGLFDNKSDAIKARTDAELHYGFHPNHGVTYAGT